MAGQRRGRQTEKNKIQDARLKILARVAARKAVAAATQSPQKKFKRKNFRIRRQNFRSDTISRNKQANFRIQKTTNFKRNRINRFNNNTSAVVRRMNNNNTSAVVRRTVRNRRNYGPVIQRTIMGDDQLDDEEMDLERVTLASVLPARKQHLQTSVSREPISYMKTPINHGSIHHRLGPQVKSEMNANKVLVTNLHPTSVSRNDIIELFSGMGELQSVKMGAPGTAVVCFTQECDALKAINAYHNRSLDGQPMQVTKVSRYS